MAARKRLICRSLDLADGGDGVRFEVEIGGRREPAFAIRHRGRVYAYLNRCAHLPMELDWMPGRFFDSQGALLVCSTHGAIYEPESGRCVGGPCAGGRLVSLAVKEHSGKIFVEEHADVRKR